MKTPGLLRACVLLLLLLLLLLPLPLLLLLLLLTAGLWLQKYPEGSHDGGRPSSTMEGVRVEVQMACDTTPQAPYTVSLTGGRHPVHTRQQKVELYLSFGDLPCWEPFGVQFWLRR